MKKCGADPKVKKTLVRNYEQKVNPTRKKVVQGVTNSSRLLSEKPSCSKESELSEPALCSSEAIAQYLDDVKKSAALPPSHENLNVDKQTNVKITKKLNFHFNDKIYKNLIELNTSVAELKKKKERRPTSIKKDLEPNIEDFYEDIKEIDIPPNIPVTRPKSKPIKKIEDGDLYKLLTKFECL